MNAEDGQEDDDVDVPVDFPWNPFPASLPGNQMKFSARKIDGKYVVGLTELERTERYVVCLDLLEQLTEYTQRKRQQRADISLVQLLDQIDASMRSQGWGLGQSEYDWIMGRLRERFLTL